MNAIAHKCHLFQNFVLRVQCHPQKSRRKLHRLCQFMYSIYSRVTEHGLKIGYALSLCAVKCVRSKWCAICLFIVMAPMRWCPKWYRLVPTSRFRPFQDFKPGNNFKLFNNFWLPFLEEIMGRLKLRFSHLSLGVYSRTSLRPI